MSLIKMKFRVFIFVIAIVFASDYSYHDGGRDWTGECQTGQLQSPIMLMDFKPAFSGLSALKLNYTPFPKDQDPQTNTVQLNNVPGSLTGNDCTGKGPFTWNAKHLKFHAPAEHKIRGIKFDLEMQIVHEDDTRVNKSAVLGVIFKTGKENKFLASVIAGGQIDLAQLFGTTELKRYYAYSGSITAPPCTENVNWYIWSKVQEASEEQIKFFTALWAKNKEFAGGRGNNRAQQKTNERPVFHFNQEHSHSQHIDLNVLRREAVRVSLITIEQIEQELADKVAQIYELQNKYDSEYELASNKEHYKDNWFKNMVSSLRKTYDNYLIMVHVCEHLYPNDPRCNNIDVFDDKYDGRGVDFLSEFIEEIQDTIQNEVEMIKRSKDSL